MDFEKTIQILNQDKEVRNKTLGLIGPLGSGKTWFTRQWLDKLNHDFIGQVSSPTYNYCNEYKIGSRKIYHYDLFRIEDPVLLNEIGIWESIENPRVMKIIEWVDLFPEIAMECDYWIKILSLDNKKTNYYLKDRCKFDLNWI